MTISKLLALLTIGAALTLSGSATMAADGKTKAGSIKTAKGHPLRKLWSGYRYASKSTQGMQDDEFANPAMAWHDIGQEEWSKVDGKEGKACATCHKDAMKSMKGVGARYPIYHEPSKKLLNVEDRINLCRTKNMGAKKWKYDSAKMLGMSIFVQAQSRGMPVKVDVSGKAKPFFEKGKAFYYQRRGQLDMACAHCHEKYYGMKIRMNTLSQGMSNGFPTYRLKWQKPGSLHRRFSGCNKQVRAKPFKKGSDEYMNLELYLAWRGMGLPVETPAVRY
jgi:sulfur-oxidizing protein SoxA